MRLGSCHTDTYLQASYNGVAFTAMEVSSEHGRRSSIGEFPFSDSVAGIDMGRKARRYSLTARLDDDDHEMRAIALIAACELPGPGILVHPTRGVLNVTCERLTVSNDIIEKQGITKINLEFVEFNLWENGFGLTGSLLGLVLRPLLEASSNQFRSSWSPRSDPVYEQAATIRQASATATDYCDQYLRVGGTDPRIAADLRRVASDEGLLISDEVMDDTVRLGSAAVSKAASAADPRYQAFRTIANSAASMAVSKSSEALTGHVRRVSAAYMAQAALAREYRTIDLATAATDQVTTILKEEARIAYDACENVLFLEIEKFAADFARQMHRVAYGAPRKQTYNFKGKVPALVAAYAIWDDATKAREIGIGLVGPKVMAAPNG